MKLIPCRNGFFLYENLQVIYTEKEREAHVLGEKSISASKIDVLFAMSDYIPHSAPTRFLLGS